MERAFFLVEGAEREPPELLPEEQAHARRVLRLGPGDALVGLDGRGHRAPLRVRAVGGGRLEVERAGPVETDPEPGAPGAPLPWIELACALPREKRAEALVDQLTQLGLAALQPLDFERTQGPRRGLAKGRRRRLERAAREACKQSGQTRIPELADPLPFEEWLARRAEDRPPAPIVALDPGASDTVLAFTGGLGPDTGTRARPIGVLVGPEGGLTDTERARLAASGAARARLGPHVLRIETAAVAALATLVALCPRRA